jgi:hypothetical protein
VSTAATHAGFALNPTGLKGVSFQANAFLAATALAQRRVTFWALAGAKEAGAKQRKHKHTRGHKEAHPTHVFKITP